MEYDSVISYNHMIKSLEIPEFTYPQVLIYNVPLNRDYLARAYAGLGKSEEAISEYEKLITFDPDGTDRRLINPRYHYSLGMLYEKKGMKDKAIFQYQKFLELWKDADPVFSEPADARKRLNGLTGRECLTVFCISGRSSTSSTKYGPARVLQSSSSFKA